MEQSFNKNRDKFHQNKFIQSLPSILAFIVLMLYFSFFTLGYLVPFLFPNSFFHSMIAAPLEPTFLLPKIIILSLTFPLLFISCILTIITEGKEIPDEPPWLILSLNGSSSVNPQQQIESLALEIVNRKETLLKNSNRLYLPKPSYQSTNSLLTSSSAPAPLERIASDDYYITSERTDKDEVRYCATCRKFRPDRSHHCKQCNKCYLKMDHHCFWLNNCISMTNYKYFLSTILYASCITLLCLWCLFDLIKLEWKTTPRSSMKLWALVMFFIVTLAFFVLMSMLLSYHLNLILSNFTTFEHAQLVKDYEGKKPERKLNYNTIDAFSKCRMEETAVSMYDIGKWNNFCQVFGTNPLLWLLPIRSESYSKGYGNGLNFETNEKKNAIEIIRSI